MPTYEEEFTDPSGGEACVWLTTKSPLRDGDSSIDAVLTSSLNITDRKKAERHLAHLAHHDALTGLPNRTFLQDRIRRELARARRGDRMFALLMLDIDRFKTVNDALGHHAGDALICSVGERLGGMLRKKDVIARLGGDEFAILLGDLRENQQAVETAETLLGALKQPFTIAGEDIVVSASIGLVLHPNDGDDAENLLKKVDIAMYRAKAEGRNVCRAFDPAMMTSARGEITPGGGIAPCPRQPGIRTVLPAADRSAQWADHRCRGADPLAPSRAGSGASPRLSPLRRGDGADHPDQRMGDRRRPAGSARAGARTTCRACAWQ